MRDLDTLYRHRKTFIEYAQERIEDEDWHGLSDAANDLRELDVEIRMTADIKNIPVSWETLKT